ncbi:MAG: ABC transporter ATP-binding protein, partial [Planctomycetales bacterium]
LADEPTGNLDRASAETVGALLSELQKQEDAVMIVVTHNLELAETLERRAELDAGKLTETSAAK